MSREVAVESMPSGLWLLIKKKIKRSGGRNTVDRGYQAQYSGLGNQAAEPPKRIEKTQNVSWRFANWQHVQQKSWGTSEISDGNDGNSGELHAFGLSERLTPAQSTTPYAAKTGFRPVPCPLLLSLALASWSKIPNTFQI